ncbi:lipoprotein-releasing system permease protein [Rheinheimera pacifica]|uniref:lipoprotein-releasing ABC transporter permease subunit n=1 Tax=Rheinheimera pacifica TaxID=173990 RepID=UPI0028666A79|nr:lipoprotein-releasing ABC transporter permease subunit [Rheinheimera pacifica]MDR6982583.1 lipoprotein-releasing system permease protein [Rheinheimera pacifica]
MASLAWQLARRYRSTRHSSGFIRFISASSTLGIALGVAILILALSVMNGFELALKQRLLSVIPHVELEAVQQNLHDWQRKQQLFAKVAGVEAVAPYIKSNGMLRAGTEVKAAEVRGIDITSERRISDFASYISAGQLDTLQQSDIVLGQGIADALNVKVGGQVQLLLPRLTEDGRLASHSTASLTVSAIVAVGGQLDYSHVWLDMATLASLLAFEPDTVQGFAFRLDDIFQAPQMARELGRVSEDYVYLLDWFRSQGHVYQDIQMVRSILYLVLALVIAVASFNIVATLVMAVREKEGDIAILLTMGVSPAVIIRTFMWLGWLNGLIGAVAGLIVGVLLASYIEPVFAFVTSVLGKSLLDPSIYFINFVPSLLQWQDVLLTFGVAIVMSLLATLYPAWRASKVQPARVLGQR